MRVVVIEKPQPFVSLADAKKYLRVEGDDDTVITSLIAAACQDIDGPKTWLGRAIGVQVIEVFLPAFGHCPTRLPGGDVLDVIEVGYVDQAGTAQMVPADVYELRGSDIGSAWGKSWPAARYAADAVSIRYRAGYGKLNSAVPPVWIIDGVPEPIRIALLMHVGALYRARGDDEAVMPAAARSLLEPYRIWTL